MCAESTTSESGSVVVLFVSNGFNSWITGDEQNGSFCFIILLWSYTNAFSKSEHIFLYGIVMWICTLFISDYG